MRAQTRGRRRRSERGSVLVFVAVAMPVLILMTSFAVDLGRQRALRRDLQADADVISLDLIRLVEEPGAAPADDVTLVALNRSLQRNGMSTVNTINGAEGALVEWGEWVEPTPPQSCSVTSCFTTPSASVNAVRVTLEDDVDYLFRSGSGGATRAAVASIDDRGAATISVGSKLASLDASASAVLNPLLSGLLGGTGTPLNLDLVGYQGLAAANINLGLLAGELGFGSTEELLAADNVNVAELMTASATVLGIETPAGIALNDMAFSTDPNFEIPVGDLIVVEDGGEEAAANAFVNVYDLAMGSIQLANKENLVTVDGLTLGIPGLASSSLTVKVIEAPQIAAGPARRGADGEWVTRARTAQVEIGLDTSIGVSAGILSVTLDLPILLGAAEAEASLVDIECADPDEGVVTIDTTTDGVTATAAADLEVRLLGIPVSLPSIINADFEIASGETDPPMAFTVPPLPSDVQSMAATGLGLGTSLLEDIGLMGLPIGSALTLLRPVTTQIDQLILAPVFEALGLSVAGADVRTLGLDCGVTTPTLVE